MQPQQTQRLREILSKKVGREDVSTSGFNVTVQVFCQLLLNIFPNLLQLDNLNEEVVERISNLAILCGEIHFRNWNQISEDERTRRTA
jgi:hypothetical protein